MDGSEPAGIAYCGIAGASRECVECIERLLQFGDELSRARILTNARDHCLILTVGVGDRIAVKSGFSSGYSGEGPRSFSRVLQLLDVHGAEIDEIEVDDGLVSRVDASALSVADIDRIDEAKPVRPGRWYEYVLESDYERTRDGALWSEFPHIVPFAIIENRIVDLAIGFWNEPDSRLLTGYRRLEDSIRERTGLASHGQALFAQAFRGKEAKLQWRGIDEGEKEGRVQLFVGAFMAYRNPRSHREPKHDATSQLMEFLLLNHLFILEGESQPLERSVA